MMWSEMACRRCGRTRASHRPEQIARLLRRHNEGRGSRQRWRDIRRPSLGKEAMRRSVVAAAFSFLNAGVARNHRDAFPGRPALHHASLAMHAWRQRARRRPGVKRHWPDYFSVSRSVTASASVAAFLPGPTASPPRLPAPEYKKAMSCVVKGPASQASRAASATAIAFVKKLEAAVLAQKAAREKRLGPVFS
jgi:hypothetical protein